MRPFARPFARELFNRRCPPMFHHIDRALARYLCALTPRAAEFYSPRRSFGLLQLSRYWNLGISRGAEIRLETFVRDNDRFRDVLSMLVSSAMKQRENDICNKCK